ncbi:hypothetical protein ACTG9Q_21285 [Actinokineospora sp. 24-640]
MRAYVELVRAPAALEDPARHGLGVQDVALVDPLGAALVAWAADLGGAR